MKNLKPNVVRNIILIGLGILIAVITIFLVLKNYVFKPKAQKSVAVIEEAPQDALNRGLSGKTYLSSGKSYRVDESGNLIISMDGKDYIVRPDGTVWLLNEDGTYSLVTDQDVINSVLTAALQAAKDDPLVAAILDEDLILSKIDLTLLSDAELRELANILGVNADELLSAVNKAKEDGTSLTLSDAMQTLDLTRMTDDELASLARALGLDSQQFVDIVRKTQEEGRAISLNEAIAEVLKNDDKAMLDSYLKSMTANDPDFYKNYGLPDLTADDLLAKLEGSYNPATGAPYTADEFMQIALKDGIIEALKTVGYEVREDDKLLDVPEGYNSSSRVNEVGMFLGDSNTSSYDPTQDLTYLANLASQQAQESSSGSTYDIQNGQSAKKSFLVAQQNGGTTVTVAENMTNMITAGTIINATLYTGAITDLPGQLIAIVSQNVYDSFNQTNLLIPKGSRLIATYDSAVSWGQDRLLVAWNQLIRPDGVIVNLNGYQGIDMQGYAGISGSVNNHIFSIVGATGIATAVDYVGQRAANRVSNELLNALVGGTSGAVNDVTQELLSKAINRQPTITIPQATKISIFVNDNVVLTTYRE